VKFQDYRIRAVNDAKTSENRIHSDTIARQFGFEGALVSGVSVFGYLTHPLVARFGADWFRNGIAEVRFIKPAYEGDEITISTAAPESGLPSGRYRASAVNDRGEQLAQLEYWKPQTMPELDPRSGQPAPRGSTGPRPDISWDAIKVDRPAPIYDFGILPVVQKQGLEIMRDELPLYRSGKYPIVHPYLLLKEANYALMRLYVLHAWIHVGSRVVLREPIYVYEDVQEVTTPIEKWTRKGHEFIRLYNVFWSQGTAKLEIEHTAIFRIANA
jgi:hypothetical protein